MSAEFGDLNEDWTDEQHLAALSQMWEESSHVRTDVASFSEFARKPVTIAEKLECNPEVAILLTKNQSPAYVLQSLEGFKTLLDRIELLETELDIASGIKEKEAGLGVPVGPALKAMHKKLWS